MLGIREEGKNYIKRENLNRWLKDWWRKMHARN